MKKLAFFLSLIVGLNATGVVRRPEEEENQAVIIKDSPRFSTAALINLIANKLRTCYYGVTTEGLIHELRLDLIQKMEKLQVSEKQYINSVSKNTAIKNKEVWMLMSYHLENNKEKIDYQFLANNSAD